MNNSDKIFEPEKYTYSQYKLWEGDWELIKGFPHAMSPSPKREYQKFSGNFHSSVNNLLKEHKQLCNCEVYYELDWIVSENTVVRPDVMIVCGEFKDDFLNFPPTLILEITSPSTYLRDRNTKFNLYEMYGVKYYIIADPQKKSVEVFELTDNVYRQTTTTDFILTPQCSIALNVFNLWD
jgi:Uma2 family endonuclease